MKTHHMIYLILALLAGALANTACSKEEEATDRDTQQAADVALADQVFNDVADMVDEAGMYGTVNLKQGASNSLLSACATVTVDTLSVPHLITIDFGSVNCLCNDGKYRRGIILVSFTGHFLDSLASRTITFNNYYVNDNQVTGTKTITNNGHNNAGHLVYTTSINGALILANNAGTISWTASRTREWVDSA